MKGIIALWSGTLEDIPFGWKLCDGNNGTPDLRNQFVLGAGPSQLPGTSGGSNTHSHDVNLGTHAHDLLSGDQVSEGSDYAHTTNTALVDGTTDPGSNIPVFYALAYIMHI